MILVKYLERVSLLDGRVMKWLRCMLGLTGYRMLFGTRVLQDKEHNFNILMQTLCLQCLFFRGNGNRSIFLNMPETISASRKDHKPNSCSINSDFNASGHEPCLSRPWTRGAESRAPFRWQEPQWVLFMKNCPLTMSFSPNRSEAPCLLGLALGSFHCRNPES